MDLSIVIPTYNEEKHIGRLLDDLQEKIPPQKQIEIIVVDGQSTDNTCQIVSQKKVVLLHSTNKSRSFQLALGASVAKAKVLYFLHADTFPPKHFISLIEHALASGYQYGCFCLKFKPSTRFLRFFEYFVQLPILLARGGDQSLFVTRSAYENCGGFDKQLSILEDIDLIRKLAKSSKIKIIEDPVITSSRKYLEKGQVKLQWTYAKIHVLYFLGFSPNTIFSIFRHVVETNGGEE